MTASNHNRRVGACDVEAGLVAIGGDGFGGVAVGGVSSGGARVGCVGVGGICVVTVFLVSAVFVSLQCSWCRRYLCRYSVLGVGDCAGGVGVGGIRVRGAGGVFGVSVVNNDGVGAGSFCTDSVGVGGAGAGFVLGVGVCAGGVCVSGAGVGVSGAGAGK